MGQAILVNIGEQEFLSKKAAINYFMQHRDNVREWGSITGGSLFEALKALYLSYCESSQDRALNSRVIMAFSVDYEPQKNGQACTSHLCYWVHFSKKQKIPFSIQEAVYSIVKATASEKLDYESPV